MNFTDTLIDSINKASVYNANDQTPPACIIWTDQDAQWQALFPALIGHLPIFQLGEYDPESRTGPAYWLRCVIAGMFPEIYSPEQGVPILYLPGVSRQELRAVEDCPKALQPLAELQYRGVLWSQKNAKDWTVAAFLQSHDGGLGIEVSADQATRDAMLRSLPKLAMEAVEHLQQQVPLKAAFFDALLNPDETRSLLEWLNNPSFYKQNLTEQEWQAFCSICQQKYKFHPEKDGQLNAALLLGERMDAWKAVWERYRETPTLHPLIPQLLRQIRPLQFDLFDRSESWPQDNEAAEEELRDKLAALSQLPAKEAREQIRTLDELHGIRRTWVWAQLGNAPLAIALEKLKQIADGTKRALSGNSVSALAQAYNEWGWQVDLASIQVLEMIHKSGSVENIKAIEIALHAIYSPWLEESAITFQKVVKQEGYTSSTLAKPQNGTCILFSDALRTDLAHWLKQVLTSEGCRVEIDAHLSALPPITATSKPALPNLSGKISGSASSTLNPTIEGRGASLTAEHLRKLLAEDGYQILSENDPGNPIGIAWSEIGAIDAYGHDHGVRLVLNLQNELNAIKNRIVGLLHHGWKQVILVTDHGWLLMPGGLPKTFLPEHLTEVRKGRCARMKFGSTTDQQTLPWYWDTNVSVAYAPGISCYEAGKEYEHGGLSPQECITPLVTVSLSEMATTRPKILESKWRGLRCFIELEDATPLMTLDIRVRPADPSTSMITTTKKVTEDIVSLTVENEDWTGKDAFIVILDANGQLLQQARTIVGG